MKEIYVQLLNEGTEVFRPVPVTEREPNVFQIMGHDIYDRDDETWEFEPGTIVFAEERVLSGVKVLVAVKEKK
jgi:hypothetical protein